MPRKLALIFIALVMLLSVGLPVLAQTGDRWKNAIEVGPVGRIDLIETDSETDRYKTEPLAGGDGELIIEAYGSASFFLFVYESTQDTNPDRIDVGLPGSPIASYKQPIPTGDGEKRLYFEVVMNGSPGQYKVSYTYATQPQEGSDDRDPVNDDPDGALDLPKNRTLKNFYLPKLGDDEFDEDWFKLPLDEGRYRLTLTVDDPAVEPILEFFKNKPQKDKDGKWVIPKPDWYQGLNGKTIEREFDIPAQCKIDEYANNCWRYVRVRGAFKMDYSFGTYDIKLEYAPPAQSKPDAFEPNNEQSEASAVVRNGSLKGANITAGDVDWFKSQLPTGRYAVDITPTTTYSNTIDLVLDIIKPDGSAPVTTRSYGHPLHINFEVPASMDGKTYYFKVAGGFANVDYSPLGTYEIGLSYQPPAIGVEDDFEPNNDEAHSTLLTYNGTLEKLSLYSTSIAAEYKPDVDYFRVSIPKDMDWYCTAESDNPVMDLGIQMYLPGKGNMGKYRGVYYPNFKGVNPYFGVHGLRSGETVIVKVVLENGAAKDAVAGINYKLTCSTGSLEPAKPTKVPANPPTATPAPGGSGSSNGGGGYTTPPTPTPQPNLLTFIGRLIGNASGQPTPSTNIEFVTSTFQVYSDENGNLAPDPNEWISGLTILIIDKSTGQTVQTLETNSFGQVTLTLTKQQRDRYNYAVPLLNLNRPLEEVINIVPPRPTFPSIIP